MKRLNSGIRVLMSSAASAQVRGTGSRRGRHCNLYDGRYGARWHPNAVPPFVTRQQKFRKKRFNKAFY
jgi:hypothetical protein